MDVFISVTGWPKQGDQANNQPLHLTPPLILNREHIKAIVNLGRKTCMENGIYHTYLAIGAKLLAEFALPAGGFKGIELNYIFAFLTFMRTRQILDPELQMPYYKLITAIVAGARNGYNLFAWTIMNNVQANINGDAGTKNGPNLSLASSFGF